MKPISELENRTNSLITPSDIFSSITHKYFGLHYTFILSLSIALFFVLIRDDTPFWENLVFSLTTGYTVHLSLALFGPLIKSKSRNIQWALTLTILIPALGLGFFLGSFFTHGYSDDNVLWFFNILINIPLGLAFSAIFIWIFYTKAKQSDANALASKLELKATTKEKQLSQAQLNLLQAQIEPHFLFNTLATVHSLIEAEPKRASSLLEEVNTYLRAALDHSRSKGCLLEHEIDLLRSYLGIMKTRMGTRFEFDIIVDKGVLKLPFPPMLLQPLVENAIKHGLEPKVNGGTLQISGMLKDDKLCLDVIDSGVGFADFKGEGIGLSNVRDRLNTLYSGAAIFEISELGKRGVRASIQIPVNLL